jgi:hypothetical protein
MSMRAPLLSTITLGLLASTSTLAAAEDDVVGGYDVKFEEVANNCTGVGMTLTRGGLNIEVRKGQLTVDIERIPLMAGAPAKGGKLRATSKLGPTSITGLDGKFSLAGRVQEGMLNLVFVAEYFVNRQARCSQSWKIAGVKREADKPAPGGKAAKPGH